MTGAPPSVAVITMRPEGHVRRCVAIAASLIAAGAEMTVFTHADWEDLVTASGARFCDLYAGGRSLTADDEETWPHLLRFLTFARAVCSTVRSTGRSTLGM